MNKQESNTKVHNFTIDTEIDKDVEKVLTEWSRSRRKSERIRDAIRLWIKFNELQENNQLNQFVSKETNDIKNINTPRNIEKEEIENTEQNSGKTDQAKKKEKKDVLDNDMFKQLMQEKFNK
ncbi:hypothetical protein P8822_00095 [Bacillus sonorensis]|uniref:hypothetical protein n=1 Tax=Bacillus subtilis group TaxID=653685 RepID=UPI001FD7231B|nr:MULTISPECIES: hypothetical protein [Bacillus subtilis group]MCJ8223722.1 hypothetical protein [Bacillus paralicheniformis]MEC0526214.1 hypothetical protein [Bacillus sonorensis]